MMEKVEEEEEERRKGRYHYPRYAIYAFLSSNAGAY